MYHPSSKLYYDDNDIFLRLHREVILENFVIVEHIFQI